MKKPLIVLVGAALALGLSMYLAEALLSPDAAPPQTPEPTPAVEPPPPAPTPTQPAAPTTPAPAQPTTPATPAPAPTQPPAPATPAPAPAQPAAPTAPAPAPAQPAAPATPAPPQPATPETLAPAQPAAPPTPAPARPAEPPKQPEGDVILSALPDASGVDGGAVVYAKEAFPILADTKKFDVQRQLGLTRPALCRTCRGTGKAAKKRATSVTFARLDGKPLVNTWEETCPNCRCEAQGCPPTCPLMAKGAHLSCERCTGRGEACPILVFMPHCCPQCHARYNRYYYHCGGNCCGAYHSNQPTCPKCKACVGLRRLRQAHSFAGACNACRTARSCDRLRLGHGSLFKADRVTTYLDLVEALAHVERGDRFSRLHKAAVGRMTFVAGGHVARHFVPVWNQTRAQPPRGQAAIAIGRAVRITGPQGPIVYSRLSGDDRQPLAIVAGAGAHTIPDTRVVVGGLIVGRWTPSTGGPDLPVILAIVTATGPDG